MNRLIPSFIFLFLLFLIFNFPISFAQAEIFPGCKAGGESVCNILDAIDNSCFDACRILVSDCCNSSTINEYTICFNDLTSVISDADSFCSSIIFGVRKPVGVPGGGPGSLNETLNLLQKIAGWLFAFTIVIGVIAIIIAGIVYITSGGNVDRAKIAGKMVLYSVIGFLIAGLAWSILSVINSIIE